MSNSNHVPHTTRWSPMHIILAALLGTLVAVAIAAVVAISLAPPNIYFSIHDTSLQKAPANGQNAYSYYNFTLVANNTGKRMEVHYGALRAEIWINSTLWLPAVIDDKTGDLVGERSTPQPPMGNGSARGWAEYYEYDQTIRPSVTASETWPYCTVVVVAKVWFKCGRAITRPYRVRVACKGVNFYNNTRYADCTA